MKGLFASLALASLLFGCGAGDDTADGTHAECAYGGALNDCPAIDRTVQGACWRLVDCAVIPVKSDAKQKHFDWGRCVDKVQGASATGEQLIIDCIAASSCDQLRVNGSPDDPDQNQLACFHLGGL